MRAHALLEISHDTLHVAITNVESNNDPSPPILALNLVWPCWHGNAGDLRQRYERSRRGWNIQPLQRFDGCPIAGVKPYHHIEATLALVETTGRLPGECCLHGSVDVGNRNPQCSGGSAVHGYNHLRQTVDRFDVDIGRTRYGGSQRSEGVGKRGKFLKVLTKHLDNHVLSGTGHQLVESHLNRLLYTKLHSR